MSTPGREETTGFAWRLRRTGTGEDGTTYVVDEATGEDNEAQVHLVYNRLESYSPAGLLLSSELRKHRLRWWEQEQLIDALLAAGFVDTRAVGTRHNWIAVARRP